MSGHHNSLLLLQSLCHGSFHYSRISQELISCIRVLLHGFALLNYVLDYWLPWSWPLPQREHNLPQL